MEQAESVILLFLKINQSLTMSMKRSRRELSIDMVVLSDIFDEITLPPVLACT